MTTVFNELQARYISHFITKDSEMSVMDAKVFLDMLRSDTKAEFRESRIKSLEQYLGDIERKEQADLAWEAKWIPLAQEDKETKARWESLGAKWRGWHIYTIWEYEGIEFYRWAGGFGRPSVVDEIVKVREANKRLSEIIANKNEVISRD